MNRKRSLPQQTAASQEKKPKLCLYLEDNTPIRTVEVSNVPTEGSKEFCKAFVKGYFDRDGPVERVQIVQKSKNERLAYVTFVVPDDAAALIHNKDTAGYARCSAFAIKIADDAHQIKIDPNALTIEEVNDHCLLYIMSHLTLMEAINLAKTSKRMQYAGQLHYQKYKKFSFGMALRDASINEENLPVILEAIGDYVTSIDWHNLNAVHLGLLAKHCSKVTELKLTAIKRNAGPKMAQYKNFFVNLKKLYIESSTNLADTNIRYMMSGRVLRTLDLQNCTSVRGKFFNSVNHSKLKNVKIVGCRRMDKKNFNLPGWKGKFSTFASDSCCSYVEFLALPEIKLAGVKELHLDISCFKGATAGLNISGLKKLKKLRLSRLHQWNAIDANNIINEFARIDSVESLTIDAIIVDNNTIQALRSFKNLKFLRMDRIDNQIGRNLYEQIREYLPTLQELSIQYARYDVPIGKPVIDMIAGMPALNYFAHSSINWEWLDGIGQSKSIAVFNGRKPPLKIGVTMAVFNDAKKDAFEVAHNGSITLSIHKQ